MKPVYGRLVEGAKDKKRVRKVKEAPTGEEWSRNETQSSGLGRPTVISK